MIIYLVKLLFFGELHKFFSNFLPQKYTFLTRCANSAQKNYRVCGNSLSALTGARLETPSVAMDFGDYFQIYRLMDFRPLGRPIFKGLQRKYGPARLCRCQHRAGKGTCAYTPNYPLQQLRWSSEDFLSHCLSSYSFTCSVTSTNSPSFKVYQVSSLMVSPSTTRVFHSLMS